MISFKTTLEIIHILKKYRHSEIEEIFHVFGLDTELRKFGHQHNVNDKTNLLIPYLKVDNFRGPFSESFRKDLIQYLIDAYYRGKSKNEPVRTGIKGIQYDDLFSYYYEPLANALKRDGYVIKGTTIKKLLPEEIDEAKTESELFRLLNKFGFINAKGHLEQAITNHTSGNWAAANSQFRPFIESLLIEIANHILPKNPCKDASSAIKLLSETASPVFLSSELNEVEHSNLKQPFVIGLWKRLHPEGSHPGLSDEEDSTFRYHMSIVFAHYLLRRLETRPK